MGDPGTEEPGQAQGARGAKRPREAPGVTGSEIKVAKTLQPVPRKAAMAHAAPVPQTDAGGRGEDPQAGGGSIVKELGKMAP